MLYEVCSSNADFSDLKGIGLSLNQTVKAKIIVHVFIFIYLSIDTDLNRLEHFASIDNFEKEIKIRWVHSLHQLTTFANPHCSRLRYRGLILEIIFKGTVTCTNKITHILQLLFRSCFE